MRLAATLLSILLPGFALAAGPQAVNYEGVLTDASGVPLDGAYDVRLGLYPLDPTGPGPTAAPIVEQTFRDAPVSQGRLQLLFGGSPAFADHFKNFDDLYIVLDVDLDDSGKFEEPERYSPATRLSNAPYALSSAHADTATHADSADNATTADSAVTAGAVDWSGIQDRPAGLDDGDDDSFQDLADQSLLSGDVPVFQSGEFVRRQLYFDGGIFFPDDQVQTRAALDPGEVGREAGINPCALQVILHDRAYTDVELVGDFTVDPFFDSGGGGTQVIPQFSLLVLRRALTGDRGWQELWTNVREGSLLSHDTELAWTCGGSFGSFTLAFGETLVEDYEIKPSDSGLYYEHLSIYVSSVPDFTFTPSSGEPPPFDEVPPTLGLRNGLSQLPAPGNQADEAVIRVDGQNPLPATLLSGLSFDGSTIVEETASYSHFPAQLTEFEFAIRPTSLTPPIVDSITETLGAVGSGTPNALDFEIELISRGSLTAEMTIANATMTGFRLYQADDGMPLMNLEYTAPAGGASLVLFP